MHKALNETLAALPDDTKVYVCFLPPIIGHTTYTDFSSPVMNTPRRMSNSALQFHKQNRLRSFRRLRNRTKRPRESSLSVTRRLDQKCLNRDPS